MGRLGLHPVQEGGAVQDDLQRVDVDGLRLVVERPRLDRAKRIRPIGVAREDHDPGFRGRTEDLFERQQPFLCRMGGGREP